MTLRTQLSEALKIAMKSREATAVSTLRLILAALKDRDIAARSKGNTEGIGEDEILGLLQQMVKQRHESIEMYEQGGRLELAEKEGQEIVVIETFLPTQLDEAAMTAAVGEVIAETGAANLKDMGKVMARLRERYAGQMDFGKASAIAKQQLS